MLEQPYEDLHRTGAQRMSEKAKVIAAFHARMEEEYAAMVTMNTVFGECHKDHSLEFTTCEPQNNSPTRSITRWEPHPLTRPPSGTSFLAMPNTSGTSYYWRTCCL